MSLKGLHSIAAVLIFTLPTFAQQDIDSLESISFAYGASASRSLVLVEAENNIKLKNYDSITTLVESPNIAEQFIGSILCNLLSENERIVLTKQQEQKIKDIQSSTEKLLFRYGCTCHEVMSLNEYFNGKNPCSFRKSIKNWKKELKKF